MSGSDTASLTAKTDQRGREIPVAAREPLFVDFNPETLKVSITNAMQANRRRRKKEPPQFVTDSTAKLSVELVFDTTTIGLDVREITSEIAQMMKPKGSARQQRKKKGIPAIVIFEWGTFLFEGYIDSFNETLDFFAAEGVPLRSTVSLSITEQDDPFREVRGGDLADVGLFDDAFPTTEPPVPLGNDRSIDDLALESGDPSAASRIAVENGVENRRFPEVGEVALPGGDARSPPAFASAAPGASSPVSASAASGTSGIGAASGGASAPGSGAVGAGASFGAAAGASLSAGVSGSASASAALGAGGSVGAGIGGGASASAIAGAGASASAGVSASAGAFAGLRTQGAVASRPRIELSTEAPAGLALTAGLGAGIGAAPGANVRLGGSAQASAGAGLSADVGASAGARIIFEES
ncbi:MAG: hypothetical protein AAF637_03245 [Pseudomonadota bacterium]